MALIEENKQGENNLLKNQLDAKSMSSHPNRPSTTPGAFEDQRKTISSKQSGRHREKVVFEDTRVPRSKMAVQAHAALEADI